MTITIIRAVMVFFPVEKNDPGGLLFKAESFPVVYIWNMVSGRLLLISDYQK